MMNWLPVASNFSADLRSATQSADPADCLERLSRLAQHRTSFVETLQLDRALGRIDRPPTEGFLPMRLAVLASHTIDHLLPGIRVAGLRQRLLIDVRTGVYGQYRQDVFDAGSWLHRFAPDKILFSLSAREAIAGVPLASTLAEVDEWVARAVEELKLLWGKARKATKATVLQQSFLDVAAPLFGNYEHFIPGAPSRVLARLNDRLCEAVAKENVLLVDIARASERDGIDAWYDPGRWFHGKLEITPQAASSYGELVVRVAAAQQGLSKKCLVLDLDNTLWGGVVGDDGVEGIVLGEGSAQGEAHIALQRYAKQLKERGIILAVCSKNDPGIAQAAFRDHPEMILKPSDIAAFVANWDDKVENLKAIAKRLNIGLDSLVFVDDNPTERLRVRESLPMVAVPELPEDIAYYVPCLSAAGYFELVDFTTEDQKRGEQYAANAERDFLRDSAQSVGAFLRNLGMSVMFGPFTPITLPRVTQLINKTNQFNTTTRRYSAQELTNCSQASSCLTLQFRLIDRFGDNGIVSAMILSPHAVQPDAFEIDNWVMSCRVFGRELEFEAMNIAVEAARSRNIRAFYATYIPTKKNAVIRELYSRLGFSAVTGTETPEGSTRWALALGTYTARRTPIARSREAHD